MAVLRPKPPKPARKPRANGILYRGPPELVAEIGSAAKELGLSRNEAMTQLLRYALEAHRKSRK